MWVHCINHMKLIEHISRMYAIQEPLLNSKPIIFFVLIWFNLINVFSCDEHLNWLNTRHCLVQFSLSKYYNILHAHLIHFQHIQTKSFHYFFYIFNHILRTIFVLFCLLIYISNIFNLQNSLNMEPV